MWGHRHRWREHLRTCTKDVTVTNLKNCDLTQAERLTFGVTTVLFVCEDLTCGSVKSIEMLGKEVRVP